MLKSRLPAIAATIQIRLEPALAATAEEIADDARSQVPVRSGRLRDAIHVERDGRNSLVVAGDHDAYYGHLVEFGTNHTPPRPFLTPAAETGRNPLREAATLALRRL